MEANVVDERKMVERVVGGECCGALSRIIAAALGGPGVST